MAYEIYTKYLETLQGEREAMNNFRNGIIKYFIPSVGGVSEKRCGGEEEVSG